MNILRDLESRILRLEALARGRRKLYAEYNTAAGQAFVSGVGGVVNYGTRVRDTHNAVTAGTAWAFVSPSPGPICVSLCLTWESKSWAADAYTLANLRINSAYNKNLGFHERSAGGSAIVLSVLGHGEVWMDAGQTLDIYAFHNAGGTLALYGSGLYNWITISG